MVYGLLEFLSTAPRRSMTWMIAQGLRAEAFAPVLEDEIPKPFSHGTRLSGDGVKLSRKAIGTYRSDRFGKHKVGLLKPSQKVPSVRQPFDLRVDRRSD